MCFCKMKLKYCYVSAPSTMQYQECDAYVFMAVHV